MDFMYTPKVNALRKQVDDFMQEHTFPSEKLYKEQLDANRKAGKTWEPVPVVEELKKKAKTAGLWNMFLPESQRGFGLPT